MSIAATSKRIWSLCHVLRDDGIVFHKYLSELTYLLFLKVAFETGKEELLPEGCRWEDLTAQPDSNMLSYYRKMLTSLGEDAKEEIVREIFRFPTTVFNHEENLRKVVEGIDAIDWHEALSDGLGAVYESLLARNASEARSGAGQYFTPRPLVDAMVRVLQPDLGETIQDPAAGTAGFLISAQTYITNRHNSSAYARNPPRFQAVEIEGDTYRLCLMNIFLHGMDGRVIHGDALTHDAEELTSPDVIIANPPFGTSVGGARARRDDLHFRTSNKQLLFLQRIVQSLPANGRAAVVLPDNVLFEENVGREIRNWLMDRCHLHTILRLPVGIFYAQGVKTNVIFFTKIGEDATNSTREVWFYDMRAQMPSFNKTRPLTDEDFALFLKAYGNDPYGKTKRNDEGEEGRFRKFTREEIAERNYNLDISWLREDEKDAEDDLIEIDDIAAAILGHLRSALNEIEAVTEELAEAEDFEK
ncbi:SAM-dependent methyltransferase [Phaeobacter inhibens]|uniref:class I SAM-dependent DNA methyltransferase n=1 Tax=Phaeobacter inhibens TaxID=221822 RepID=UPI00097194CA|nr:N-6 DNA methylase [Phaeobacter inhibens]APX16613.1 SAM-dependent methyltransferase [Phaeobacter inhibens]